MASKEWVHFLGMCGVTMAPLAYSLEQKGYLVTGSDKAIFPPISNYIKERGMKLELGFREIHLSKDYYLDKFGDEFENVNEKPDFCVIGNFTGLNNPEFEYIKKNNIPYYSFPEILNKFVIKENSIVVVGTYGKTTTTSMLAYIFGGTKLNPSFMFGAISNNIKDPLYISDSDWSIVEGDEYSSSRWDTKSKFFHYSPKYLILTSCAWDHTDIFKTEDDYIDNFINLVKSVPEDGLIIANINGKNIDKVISKARCKVIFYSFDSNVDAEYIGKYRKSEDSNSSNVLEIVMPNKQVIEIRSNLLGKFNYENMLASFAISNELGINIEIIKSRLEKYSGIKRRLEIKYSNNDLFVIDDFSSVPAKAKGTLNSLRDEFPNHKIVAIFEPNTGNRTVESQSQYDHIFDLADEVIIPRLRMTKADDGEKRLTGEEIADTIRGTHKNTIYIDNDNELINHLLTNNKEKAIIVFMGSGSFRGMIQELIKRLEE